MMIFFLDSDMFRSVVVVAFQSAFHAEMHQNDVFLFFKKIIFDISTSKQSKTYKKNYFF